jgi:hypothetical protein
MELPRILDTGEPRTGPRSTIPSVVNQVHDRRTILPADFEGANPGDSHISRRIQAEMKRSLRSCFGMFLTVGTSAQLASDLSPFWGLLIPG